MSKKNINNRYDFFLIWGHGLQYAKEIIEIIEDIDKLEIVKIIYYRPKSIKKFINQVYNFDYAPVYHLKNKTQYLKKTPKKVLFIFVRNCALDEFWVGDIKGGHFESKIIKDTKEYIRNRYNAYINGIRTENHVIHGSDNPIQTEQMLKLLNFSDGTKIFEKSRIGGMPEYIHPKESIEIKKIFMDQLYSSINSEKGKLIVKLEESPHYRALTEDMDIYGKYLDDYQGEKLCDYYSVRKFQKLRDGLTYLERDYKDQYIFVYKADNDKYVIMDGLHRAAILKSREVRTLLVAEVNLK